MPCREVGKEFYNKEQVREELDSEKKERREREMMVEDLVLKLIISISRKGRRKYFILT